MIDIEWTEEALEDLNQLDKTVGKRILKKIAWFSQSFENIIPEPLSGEFEGTYKLRVGAWRIIYTFDKETILIRHVGHRREVYKI
ncbi:MAG TPA: type II toxin-antitoxin system RelE/ParE family toxin [bacterium]|nr:type II toxin-antitoxin system RelE/ParE family toxin [bacterium]